LRRANGDGISSPDGTRQNIAAKQLIKQIKSSRDYRRVLKEIEGLMGAEGGTAEGERLVALVTLVEAWEAKHYPMEES
jgi:antitoxin component HigA of HigAB toxin-antitoxin module